MNPQTFIRLLEELLVKYRTLTGGRDDAADEGYIRGVERYRWTWIASEWERVYVERIRALYDRVGLAMQGSANAQIGRMNLKAVAHG